MLSCCDLYHASLSPLGLPIACVLPSQHLLTLPSSDKPCELYCSPLGKESPLLVADRVLDGTPCGPYETDLCVHGRCQVSAFSDVLDHLWKETPSPQWV